MSESADSGRGLRILKWYAVRASREVLCFARSRRFVSRISLLLLTRKTNLKKSLSHLSVALPGHLSFRRSHCATDRNEGPFMEPIVYSLQAGRIGNQRAGACL